MRLGPIVGGVELPYVVVVGRRLLRKGAWGAVTAYGGPPLVIDAAVDDHLEVLGLAALRRTRVLERTHHAHSVQRHLLDAMDADRLWQPRCFQYRRGDIVHVVELRTYLAASLEAVRPVHDRAVAGAAPVRGYLLRPLIRRVHRMRPTHSVVVVGFGRAELLDPRRHELGRLHRRRPVQGQELVESAVQRALGGGTVVADDVVDERVVEDL